MAKKMWSRMRSEPWVSIDTGNFNLEIGRAFRLYMNPGRAVKQFYQRWTRGFDDTELWSLDATVSRFILPRLKAFRETTHSYPNDFKNIKDWRAALDKMVKSFEYNLHDWDGGIKTYKMKMKQYEEGMQLFAKYYGHLWS